MATDNPAAATTFVRKLQERFKPLLIHPEMGPKRDNLSPGLRVLFYRDYAIYYRFTESEVVVVHVTHGARDAAALIAYD
ncbi:MAG: type II toxin-antitoxin system RelE/ParE family toxin [Candidatus Competibacter denitrificans]